MKTDHVMTISCSKLVLVHDSVEGNSNNSYCHYQHNETENVTRTDGPLCSVDILPRLEHVMFFVVTFCLHVYNIMHMSELAIFH